MALRIRFQYSTGASLGFSIERLADGLFYDHADGTFKANPTTLVAALPPDTGSFAGRYKLTLTTTPQAQFSDGEYCLTVHDTAASNLVVGQLGAVMYGGDDAPAPPGTVALTAQDKADIAAAVAADLDLGTVWDALQAGHTLTGSFGALVGTNLDAKVSAAVAAGGGGADPLAQAVPGAYAAGTAGYRLGTYLDAKVSTAGADPWAKPLPGTYAAGTAGAIVGTNLDAPVSTAGGGSGGATAGAIADAVLDEALAGHTAPGSLGAALGELDKLRLTPGAVAAALSASVFTSTSAALTKADGAYNGQFVRFDNASSLPGERRLVLDHDYDVGTDTHTFKLANALSARPAGGDLFGVS